MLVENIMFSLIRSEICALSVDESLREELTDDKYKELYVLSVKHDLSHIVASALSKMGILGDDEVSKRLNKQFMASLYRDANREYTINQIRQLLETAQTPYMFLKGSVIRHFYPNPWMRTSCDIDVLIHEADNSSVEKALCDAGFERFEDRSTHDYNYLAPNKMHIEVHYSLTQDGKMTDSDELMNSVWDLYSIPDDGFKYSYSMTPEAFVVYHMAHLGRHILHGGCGVRPFLDLWLIKKHMNIDYTKLYYMLERCKLKSLYDASVELGIVWLEGREHNEKTALLEEYILKGGVYGTPVNVAKVEAAKGVSKFRSFMGKMFLPRANLEVIYPNLKKHPTLFPFYQVKRWFRVFNKKKRNRIKQFNDGRSKVNDKDITATNTLLNQLGLID